MSSKANSQKELLDSFQDRALSSVTFVRDYVQLNFDKPYINAYVWPKIKFQNQLLVRESPGYCDALCEQIGKVVREILVEPDRRLCILLADHTSLEISLKPSDRASVEAVMLQDGTGKLWNVW